GTFSVAYLVFNTIMNLTTQEEQVACFRNVAAHLAPGGCFVIEVHVPELRRLPPGQDVVPFHVSPARWAFDRYDVATQAMSSNYVEVVDGRGSYRSIPFRYVWPAELDLMAQLAGLRLRERWGGGGRARGGVHTPAGSGGTPPMFEHPVDVRWRDVDALGHVNHAVFLTYLEEGRDAFYTRMLGSDPIYVVARLEVDLRAEVGYA